jgi:hypothetical protein
VPVGRPFIGYAGRVGDVDYYYPRGDPGGVLDGRVSGIADVDLRVIALPAGTPVGTIGGDPAAAPGARVFDAGGAGAAEDFTGVQCPASGGAPIVVVARKDKVTPGVAQHPPARGTDVPYTLLVNRRQGQAQGQAQAQGQGR